ncbi:MAG: helix-turn-helix transcriptional regulator [Eubacteriales bacterium]|nr:helix-turn-helix transcriptional regulator [Eubacteriales bacterium]
MSIGQQISGIRKEHQLTQEKFGELFHVTRQTVSNWENEKSYPDLQTLVNMSEMFDISLDRLLKEDIQMVKKIDEERLYGAMARREKSRIDFFTGAGTGLIISCLVSPDSIRRTIVICIGIILIGIGWYKKSRFDKTIIQYLDEQDEL